MIRYIISDLDGTIVDTQAANSAAYQLVLARHGLVISDADYRSCFGLRLEEMLRRLGADFSAPVIRKIAEEKARCYPDFFSRLRVNRPLADFFRAFQRQGGRLAIVSTARRKNIENVLRYCQLADLFELTIAGEDVQHGKPDPECFFTALKKWNAAPSEALVFEDSEIGLAAAAAAGWPVIKIENNFYGN